MQLTLYTKEVDCTFYSVVCADDKRSRRGIMRATEELQPQQQAHGAICIAAQCPLCLGIVKIFCERFSCCDRNGVVAADLADQQ